jgi:hypothetical protein
VQKFDAKRLYLKTPNNVAGTEEYQVKIWNRFAAWKNVSGSKVWESAGVKNAKNPTKESVGYYKWKQYQWWFDVWGSNL